MKKRNVSDFYKNKIKSWEMGLEVRGLEFLARRED